MKDFTFELLFHLIGIGSASGLFHKNDTVYLISDNGNSLYHYQIGTKVLEKTKLIDSAVAENIPKNIKPDFEAIASYSEMLYIFGSGSTEKRNAMVVFDQLKNEVVRATDLSDLYATMQSFGEIQPADFNIEGVVYDGTDWYFLQRGNGGSGKNGIFTVNGDIESDTYSIVFNEYKLPKIGGVETSFTDAVLIGSKIYFLATAENTMSSYDDGDVLGSIIGRLDLKKMKIEKTIQISEEHKLEGLAFYGETPKQLTFLLCEDNDTDGLHSDIFKLTIKK